MSLRDEIAADIAEAFNGDLADAVASFSGSRVVPIGDPDPVTQTQASQTFSYEGRGVFGSFSNQVVDGLQILKTDTKLTVLQSELLAFDGEVVAVPEVDDMIQKIDSQTLLATGPQYRVISVSQDAASVSWSIQIRSV